MHRLLLFVFSFSLLSDVAGQEAMGIDYDCEPILQTVQQYDPYKVDSLRHASAYTYINEGSQQSFQAIFWERVASWWNKYFGVQISGSFIEVIIYVLAGFFLFLLLRFFLLKQGISFFERKKEVIPDFGNLHDISSETDFDKIISAAERDQNNTLMIKYSYLKLLWILGNRGEIKLEKYKTNYDYLHEIQDIQQKAQFSNIINDVELVLYGDIEVNEDKAHDIMRAMHTFRDSSLKYSTANK